MGGIFLRSSICYRWLITRGILFTQVALTLPFKNNTANYIWKSSVPWKKLDTLWMYVIIITTVREKIQCENPGGAYVALGTVVSRANGHFLCISSYLWPLLTFCNAESFIIFKTITLLESSNDFKVLHTFPFGLQNLNRIAVWQFVWNTLSVCLFNPMHLS